jgi:hypothetical protein
MKHLSLPNPGNHEIRPQWLTEAQTSIVTGFSVHTLRAHRQKGKGIPYIKAGKAVRYSNDDIDAFMAAHRIETERCDLHS